MKYWSVVLVCALLTSCASRQKDIPSNYTQGRQNVGIIVGSVTSLPDLTRHPPWYEMSTYYYVSIDDPNVFGVVRSGNKNTIGWDQQSCDADGLADECGRLFALELPAGKYAFKAVQVNDLASAHGIYPSEAYSLALQGFNFTVLSGEVLYLGNLHSRICIGAAGTYGRLEVWAVRGEVRDAYARDLKLLTQKYAVLGTLPIMKTLIEAKPWLWKRPKPAPAHLWPSECGPYPVEEDS